MNKNPLLNGWMLAAFVCLGFISGLVCGVTLTVWGAGYLAEKVVIKNVEVGFNETAMVDYTWEKLRAEGYVNGTRIK